MMKITAIFPPKMTLIILLALVCACVLGHFSKELVFDQVGYDLPGSWRLPRLFDLDREDSIPTWFASSLHLFIAFLLFITASQMGPSEKHRFHWRLLALIFLGLSMDEACMFHENLSPFVARFIPPSGLFYYSWIVAGAAFVGVVGLVYFRFVLALPTLIRNLFIIAAVTFVSGAIVIECFSGMYAKDHGEFCTGYRIFTAVEESFEMNGLVIFIYALLRLFQLREDGAI